MVRSACFHIDVLLVGLWSHGDVQVLRSLSVGTHPSGEVSEKSPRRNWLCDRRISDVLSDTCLLNREGSEVPRPRVGSGVVLL